VTVVKQKWARLGCVLVVVLAMVAVVASAGTSSSLFGSKFKIGEEIVFKVESSATWWWSCGSCCPDVTVLGWRVASSAGQVVYSVIHDAPVSATMWQGTWAQMDGPGVAVAAGAYTLYVDTSVGTLSRCFSIYDPCNRCVSCLPCGTCACQATSSITNCSCRTTLVFIDTCAGGCFFPFSFFGSCGCGTSSCTTCGCP
jgi:hypothetical protein